MLLNADNVTVIGSGSYQQAVKDVKRLFPEGLCCTDSSTVKQGQVRSNVGTILQSCTISSTLVVFLLDDDRCFLLLRYSACIQIL